MEDLFNQLKSQPSSNRYVNEFPPSVQKTTQLVQNLSDDIVEIVEKPTSCSSSPTAMMPTVVVASKKKLTVTQPKAMQMKPFKIRINRTDIFNFLAQENIKINDAYKRKSKSDVQNSKTTHANNSFMQSNTNGSLKKPKAAIGELRSASKSTTTTPTKAQQKQFEPAVLKKAHQLNKFPLKPCTVRLQRKNIKKLQQSNVSNADWNGVTRTLRKAQKRKLHTTTTSANTTTRTSSSSSSIVKKSNTAKRRRLTSKQTNADKRSSLFVNSTALTNKLRSSNRTKQTTKTKALKAKPAVMKKKKPIVRKRKELALRTISHDELVKIYGTRPFRAYVKMERCRYPVIQSRANRTNHNKSKNLTVSFNEVVELFGEADDEADGGDDDDVGDDDDLDYRPSTSKGLCKTNISQPVLPTRLKKIENGKVVEDIVLDQSLLVHPTKIVASTPYLIESRKKCGKKSFSPLKDDGTPSPHKERLKLANEKLPPSGLRRLRLNDDDDDDDDDDDEYIVPIDIPRKTNAQTSIRSVQPTSDVPADTHCLSPPLPDISNVNADAQTLVPRNKRVDSSSSFVSAEDQLETIEKSNIEKATIQNTKSQQSPQTLANDKEITDYKTIEEENNEQQTETDEVELQSEKEQLQAQQMADQQLQMEEDESQTHMKDVEELHMEDDEQTHMEDGEQTHMEDDEQAHVDDDKQSHVEEDDQLRIEASDNEVTEENCNDKEKETLNNPIHTTNNSSNDNDIKQHNKTQISMDDLSDISDNDNIGDDINEPSFITDTIRLDAHLSKHSIETVTEADHLLNLNDFNTNLDVEDAKRLQDKMDEDDVTLLFADDSEQISSNFIDGVDHIVNELSKDIEIESNNTKDTIGNNPISSLALSTNSSDNE